LDGFYVYLDITNLKYPGYFVEDQDVLKIEKDYLNNMTQTIFTCEKCGKKTKRPYATHRGVECRKCADK